MTKPQYEELLKEHSAKALAESFVFPVKLSPKEKKENDKALNEALAERRAATSAADKLKMSLLQLRFQIEDYLNSDRFDKNKTFGFFLKTYINSLKKKQNEFALEIDIKPIELSQYVNDHRTPPQNVIIRLELHSHNTIPAVNWYRLLEKEKIHDLNTNRKLRKEQRQFVKKEAAFA